MAVHPKAREFVDGSQRQGIAQASAAIDVADFIARHGNELLANARRHSGNAADADDAYQRGLEIFLTKAPQIEEQQLVAWMHTVIRNEALQSHRRKRNEIDVAFDEISESWVTETANPDERILDSEELGQGREALKRIKPDQTRCLLLRAEGMDYPEICEVTGFSYAKVNRCLSEGRKALRVHVGMLDSGAECTRLFPTLSMIADNQAPADLRADADVHLAHCLYCQATLRQLREAPDKVASILPIGVAAFAVSGQRGFFGRVADQFNSSFAWVQERVFGHVAGAQQGAEMAVGKKVAIVAAVSATVVAGGAIVERTVTPDRDQSRKGPAQPAVVPQAADADAAARARAAERRSDARARAAANPRPSKEADVVKSNADDEPIDRAQQTAPETTEDGAGFAAEQTDQIPAAADNQPAAGNDGGLSP